MKQQIREKGLAHLGLIIAVIVVVAAVAFGGWYVWDKNKDDKNSDGKNSSQTNGSDNEVLPTETADWVSITTQSSAFSMKVPDGWKITNYPGDFLGAMNVAYMSGTRATIETSSTEYVGHSLRFRASVTDLDDAGLGPQWASPQPGLQESIENFTIGSLQGKRYKGTFTQDLNQTLYEYVFDIGSGKKLDILYTVDHGEGNTDDVATVEKAIKTIDLK